MDNSQDSNLFDKKAFGPNFFSSSRMFEAGVVFLVTMFVGAFLWWVFTRRNREPSFLLNVNFGQRLVAFRKNEPRIVEIIEECRKDIEPHWKSFDDLVGYAYVHSMVMRTLKRFKKTKATKTLLLYGPPGTGKTALTKACAKEAKVNYFEVLGSDLASDHWGGLEKLVRALFLVVAANAPSIVCLDEADTLLGRPVSGDAGVSRKVVSLFKNLLTELKERKAHVLFIVVTNFPKNMEEAILSRIQPQVFVPLPTIAERKLIFEAELKNVKHTLSPKDVDELLDTGTKNFSGRGLAKWVEEAKELAEDEEPAVAVSTKQHFRDTRKRVKKENVTEKKQFMLDESEDRWVDE